MSSLAHGMNNQKSITHRYLAIQLEPEGFIKQKGYTASKFYRHIVKMMHF